MKNYDSNNMKNKYNYREEDKKKKKAHNLLWLLLLLCFFMVAIITVIIVGITQAWFSFTQKMEGDFTFENGIVMSYEDIDVQNGTNFHILKKQGNNYSSLNETNVRFDDRFEIINPKLYAAEGSVNFFLRAKLEYSFTKNGIDGVLGLQELADALNAENPTNNYTAENVLNAVYATTLEFSSKWLDGGDGWFYYVGDLTNWTNSTQSANFNDMGKAIVSKDTEKIEVFTPNPVVEIIPGEGNNMETFLIKSCKITLTINACEVTESAFESWLIN